VFGSIFQRRPSEERRRGCCREGFRNERPGAGASGHPLLYCNRGCCLMPLCHQVLPQFPRLPHFAICIFVSSRCFAQNTPVVEQMYTRQPPIVCVSIDLVCMRLGCAAWRFKRVPSKTTEAVRLPLCSVLFCLSTVGYFRSLMPLKQCCKRLRLNWVCLCWALSLALSVCVPLCVLNGTTRSQAGPHAHNRTSEYMHTCTHTYARLSMQYTSGVHFTFVCGHS